MNPTKIRCPHCGNNILVKQSGKVACPFCGTALYVEEKEKKVEINVNLGRKTKPEVPNYIPAFIGGGAIVLLLCLTLLPSLLRSNTGRTQTESRVRNYYASEVHDAVLRRAFAEVFEKEPSEFTAEDYQSVRRIAFRKENDYLTWMEVGFADGSETRVPMLHNTTDTIELDGTDFQAFPMLEELDTATAAGYDVSLSFHSSEYTNTLGNLKHLKKLYLSNVGNSRGPAEFAELFADPASIEALDGVYLYQQEDIKELMRYFPKLRELRVGWRNDEVSLAELKDLQELESLTATLRLKGNEDILELTQLKALDIRAVDSGESIRDLRFLSGLTQLESLTVRDGHDIKSLNMLSALTNLRELRILDGSDVVSIEPLRALTELRVLDIGDCTDITDYAALPALTKLEKLRVCDDDWPPSGTVPDLSSLTSLAELELYARDAESIANCRSIKKLTLLAERTGDGSDLSPLAGLTGLEELRLNLASTSEELLHQEVFAGLPSLSKVTMRCDTNPISLDYFPQVKEITIIGESIVGGTPSGSLTLSKVTSGGNPALESFSVYGFDGLRRGDYRDGFEEGSVVLDFLSHCPSLRELRIEHCNLSDLKFAEGLSALQFLNIADNRIEDVAPLSGLPSLRCLVYTENTIQNIGILQNKGIALIE